MRLKSTIVAFMLSLVATASFSQITFTSADVAIIGQSMTQVHDTLPVPSIQAGAGGQNKVWDFTALHTHESFPFVAVDADDTPYADMFPTADLAAIENDSSYAYFEKDSDGLRLLGIFGSFPTDAGTIELAVQSTPAMSVLRFPTTYNDGYSEHYQRIFEFAGADAGFPVDSFRVVSNVLRSVTYDAYGTLTTPAGSFQVLRVKETEVSNDTTYILFGGAWTVLLGDQPITDITYNFWTKQNGIGFPVASIQADAAGNTVSATWLKDFSVSPSQEVASRIDFDIFPNPSNDHLSLDIPIDFHGSLVAFDLLCRKVASTTVEGHFATLNTSQLKPGTYVAVLMNEHGAIAGTQRFEVAR